ncbi:MAG: hypothetical protein IJB44_08035 [Clostridia bacterium]|nr:hypothetical protein [Clostridia bacterium]
MKRSVIRSISVILVFSIVFSLAAVCIALPGAASSALKSSRELLGEYISELYLKGPSVSMSVRENLIAKGLDKNGLLEKREAFDLRLCSSDVNDGYFFTDKEEFLDIFGKTDFILLDGVYTWYAGVPEAKKAGLGITQNDPLIRYNISNALNFAIDVYGYASEDSLELFSDKFDASRKELVSFAIDCIYKILQGLEDQIGSGTNKPICYRNEFTDTFLSEDSGIYPYFDARFKKSTPVMSGYYDADAYKEKTHDYSTVKNSATTGALLSYFETAYATLKAQKDGGLLYYDFAEYYDKAFAAYLDLCSAIFKSETNTPDVTEKAKAYLKLVSLGDIFAEYILPYSDIYSTELNAVTINYITIKALIRFIDGDPYLLNSISLSSMQDLISNFTQSVSRLAPVSEYALTSQIFTDNVITVSMMKEYLEDYQGIIGDEKVALYNKAKEVIDKLSSVSTSGVTVISPTRYFYTADGTAVESEKFSFSVVPSSVMYLGMIEEAKILCAKFSEEVEPSIPKVLTQTDKDLLQVKDFIDSYSFLLGIHAPIVCEATGNVSSAKMTDSAKAILSAILKDMWSAKKITDEDIFDIEEMFSAATEFYAYKSGKAADFLNSERTVSLANHKAYLNDSKIIFDTLKASIPMIEKNMSKYKLALEYIISNIADLWKLKQESSSGNYYSTSNAVTSDGTDPANRYNYKANAHDTMLTEINGLMSAIKGSVVSDTETLICYNRLSDAVKALLSDYGTDCYNNFIYNLLEQTSLYYGSEDLGYTMFKSMLESKGLTLDRYIVVDDNGQVSASELVYKYFAFTVNAVSKDSTRINNIYTFAGNKIMINLITPLDVIVKNKGEYIGNYARDKAEQVNADMNEAQLLVSSVNTTISTVGYDITVGEAEALLARLSQVNFSLANYSLSYIASYKATTLDALMDRAMAKTIDQTDRTPYYLLICDRFQTAYSNALSVSYDKTVPLTEIDEAAQILTKMLNAMEEYERSVTGNIITVKDLASKITEAEELLLRYDLVEANSYIVDLRNAVTVARNVYSEKLITFTAEELRLEVRTLDAVIGRAKASLLIDTLMKSEIAKIIEDVKSASEYTQDSWTNYSSVLSKANLAAASTTEKVSVCNALIAELRTAVSLLKEADKTENETQQPEEKPEDTNPPENTEPEKQPETDEAADAFYAQANDVYERSLKELAEYVLSASANKEKIAAWTASLEALKGAIEAKADQGTVVANIVAIQLAKDMQIENPETHDN